MQTASEGQSNSYQETLGQNIQRKTIKQTLINRMIWNSYNQEGRGIRGSTKAYMKIHPLSQPTPYIE
ncbi:MAG: hypothetical protein EZS28_039184, partial [Streblomastix strix]